jgi:LPXTG-site transpeptidase (sortase) family protein
MKNLHINTTKHKIPRIILGAVLFLLLGCIVKVAIWEHFYYNDKEGSVRAVAPTPEPDDDDIVYDETEPTPEVIAEWKVAPDKPRYLSILKIGVKNAKILEIGVKKNNQLDVPSNIFDVGWYRNSAKPGSGGTLLIDGHNGGPTKDGVFKHLDSLAKSDLITVERGDGEIFTYEVYEFNIVPLSEADAYMSKMQTTPVPGKESLSLITCTGGWIAASRNYDHRVMLRATLVENS